MDTLHELPKDIVAESSCQKVSDKTIAFFGPYSIYSKMYQSPFVADNVYYRSSEHYIQAKKAELFDDDVQAVKYSMLTACLKQRGWVEGCVNLILTRGQRMPKTLQYRVSLRNSEAMKIFVRSLSSLADDVEIVALICGGQKYHYQMSMPCLNRIGIVMDLWLRYTEQ